MQKPCEVCKKTHSVRPADLKRGWGRACSKSCAATLSNRETGKYERYLEAKEQGCSRLSAEDHYPNKDR